MKVCPYPFSRMETGQKTFVPCCGSWLTEDYHKLKSGLNPWNSPAARALRESQFDGSYRYCRTDICGGKFFDPFDAQARGVFETPIPTDLRRQITSGRKRIRGGPRSLAINIDPRCNLACPSCRHGHINSLTWREQLGMWQTEFFLRYYRKQLEIIKLSGNGEVFFSPWLRRLLKSMSPQRYPKLRAIFLISNGLLFNEKSFRDLAPGTELIRYVSISVDAGNAETYKKVRGGDWQRLVNNLKWMAEKRRQGQFLFLEMTFTVRAENFSSIPQFVELGEQLGFDQVKLIPLSPWPTMKVDFASEAIHETKHPRHSEFLQVWDQIKGQRIVKKQFA